VGEVGVGQAAKQLGVTPQRVRQLIARGAIDARSIGGRYVLHSAALAALGTERPPGRPLSPRTSWGLVSLVESGTAPALSATERSRLRARLRQGPSLDDVARWCRRRSQTQFLRGHSSVQPQVRNCPGAVTTGASAPGSGLVDLRRAELYLDGETLDDLRRELHLESADKAHANVVVHVPANVPWPFGGSEAGPVAIALDLFDSGDPRSKRAAQTLWEHELAERRFERRVH
jgi:hypothetical protein